VGVEWWLYEITQIIASFISTLDLDAQVVIYQITVFIYMLPFGTGYVDSRPLVNNYYL
jgi:hypothetical protein